MERKETGGGRRHHDCIGRETPAGVVLPRSRLNRAEAIARRASETPRQQSIHGAEFRGDGRRVRPADLRHAQRVHDSRARAGARRLLRPSRMECGPPTQKERVMAHAMFRPRRLREKPLMRKLIRETTLAVDDQTRYVAAEEHAHKVSVGQLFADGRATRTILLLRLCRRRPQRARRRPMLLTRAPRRSVAAVSLGRRRGRAKGSPSSSPSRRWGDDGRCETGDGVASHGA